MADLFDAIPDRRPIPPCDPRVTAEERPRLSRQCQEILAVLRRGRMTNTQMAAIAKKYTSRVSDLRAAGHDVKLVDEDRKTGYAQYALFVQGREYQP